MTAWHVRSALVAVLLLVSACGTARDRSVGQTAPDVPAPPSTASHVVAPSIDRDADRQILHVLNRLAYGPRPGDVERVRAMGIRAWIEGQLHPELLADEAIERRLAAYPTIAMT